MKIIKRLLNEEQGQAIIQFSVVAIILLALFGGTVDAVNIMRYHIAISGAASEIANQIDTLTPSEVEAICEDVININYHSTLGDGNTVYTVEFGAKQTDGIIYNYHDAIYGNWSGDREYKPVTVVLKREQTLFTPFGRKIFSNSGDHRLIRGVVQTRVYNN